QNALEAQHVKYHPPKHLFVATHPNASSLGNMFNSLLGAMNMRLTTSLTFMVCCLLTSKLSSQDLSKFVDESNGQPRFVPPAVDEELRNPWPKELEDEFQERAVKIISLQREQQKAGVNTYFENEKRSYGFMMAHLLGGNEEVGLKMLQARDHQHEVWHRETAGIDYYACFTLKHQMRKYFYFGDLLAPEYKQQMYLGAKSWTEQDPFRRPHYAYDRSTGWGPNAKNSWVDVRSTENLYLMRVTSVYLMAEETGNKETTALYKQNVLNYAQTLLRIGIGEWDSENYHGHSIGPLLNLYDFAKDRQVKAAAKACLDFFAAAGAAKYWRGGFNGPTKRDYNHAQPFGGSAANSLWVWFGDHPSGKNDHWEGDEVHQITSAYRPPEAVVHLAHKNFAKPVEIFAAKPEYSATTGHHSESSAEYLETQYIAHSYQIGSLTSGTSKDGGDVCGFKLLVWDEEDGAVTLQAAPTGDASYPGSPMYKTGIVSAENRVAQQKNLAIWLTQDGKSPWTWVIPESVEVEEQAGVTFLMCDRTWVAIRGLGTSSLKLDRAATAKITEGKKARFPGHLAVSARGNGKHSFCGLAIEVGEKESHGSYAKFKKAVLAAEVDLSQLDEGVARYKASNGKHLGIHWNDDPMNLGVWRNGVRRDLKTAAQKLYDSPIIQADWGVGALRIEAGGKTHSISLSDFVQE
ncbi:MAG: hypothetical protein AAF394_14790, partial [Planctomycetota bacterium]